MKPGQQYSVYRFQDGEWQATFFEHQILSRDHRRGLRVVWDLFRLQVEILLAVVRGAF